MSDYNVALRYTAAAQGHAGVVTWISFGSKVEFDTWWQGGKDKEQEIVEEGITQDRAIHLCQTTPLRSYVAAAIGESTDPHTSKINDDLVQNRLLQIGLALLAR